MANYLMSKCLPQLSLLLFLVKKTTTGLSQIINNSLNRDSTILNLEMKLFNYTPYNVALKQ